MNEDERKMSYIARKRECGCIVGATLDIYDYRKDTAKDVAIWIREGLIVERVTSEFVRQNWHDCTHQPALPQLPKLPMFPDE